MADLDALVVFARIAQAGSFSEAARRLKMPVSTVSRRLAELEDRLGVRLLERSTRSLRLTDVGAEVLEHARRGAEISEAVDALVSNQLTKVTGQLRLSAPPSISDSFLAPLIGAFQASYPDVSVHVFVTDRFVDHLSEGVDLVFRLGALKDSNLVARKMLAYRHLLVASPAYLERHERPESPSDLPSHRLLAFSHWTPQNSWTFHGPGGGRETVSFAPHLSMNDYVGLAHALMSGAGIGDLPPLVRADLLRDGQLVEVMPKWRFQTNDLSLVHLGNRHVSRPVRVFKEFAVHMAPTLFPELPA
jgi:DNA-binding transcriptional LysR family regulator